MSETQPAGGAEVRAKIKERLRKLLAMTTENGASEAEALHAAKIAADLMAEHDLTYETVDEVKAERYGARKQELNCGVARKTMHEVNRVAEEIGKLFNCRCWQSGGLLIYFGTEADTDAAHQMRGMLCLVMEGELNAYLRSPDRDRYAHGRSLRTSFMTGMVGRLNRRLVEIRQAREAASRKVAESNGRALVLVTKQQEVVAKFNLYSAKHKLRLGGGGSRRISIGSSSAYAAGQAAGSRVDLGGSAKIGGGTKMIGR